MPEHRFTAELLNNRFVFFAKTSFISASQSATQTNSEALQISSNNASHTSGRLPQMPYRQKPEDDGDNRFRPIQPKASVPRISQMHLPKDIGTVQFKPIQPKPLGPPTMPIQLPRRHRHNALNFGLTVDNGRMLLPLRGIIAMDDMALRHAIYAESARLK